MRKSIDIEYEVLDPKELPEDEKKIYEAAREATYGAYAPYSGFHVGSGVLLEDGNVITGSNCEHETYGLTACAERVALWRAHAEGYGNDVRKLCLTGRRKDQKEGECTSIVDPCGACRAVIKEFEKRIQRKITVLFSGWEGSVVRVEGIDNLFPLRRMKMEGI
ncbi:MAG: hypothetical protein A3D92_24030 [Bacteroidetes bacterium RIFCSPHIGHO2_02_FULL_44_7]|nr:MAG: hypothetical protein A3D92_24030 [Bacteroidetes bacterium RIFCSPHIGHO2_02_FULL_44_7]